MSNNEKGIIASQVFRLGCKEIQKRFCQGEYQGRFISI